MPPFRGFLSRRQPVTNGIETGDDNDVHKQNGNGIRPSFTQQKSAALSIKSDTKEVSNEYKLSEINDSGVYLPPSPPEKKSFWHKSPHGTMSSNHRNFLNENEPFSISRESFESYRRSFDISARSPVPSADVIPTRKSFQVDSLSRGSPRQPRSALNGHTFQKPTDSNMTAETDESTDTFEDVGLNDETNKPHQKKKGFFSRLTEPGSAESTPPGTADGTKPSGGLHGLNFHIGRKRGQSGTGAELGDIERPASSSGKVGGGGKGDGVIR